MNPQWGAHVRACHAYADAREREGMLDREASAREFWKDMRLRGDEQRFVDEVESFYARRGREGGTAA